MKTMKRYLLAALMLSVLSIPAISQKMSPDGYIIHTVRWYDTISGLSKKYYVERELIIGANDISDTVLVARSKLRIPVTDAAISQVKDKLAASKDTVSTAEIPSVATAMFPAVSQSSDSTAIADSIAKPAGQQKVSIAVILPFSGENPGTLDNNLDFYKGALMAARLLGQEGTDIDLTAIDYTLGAKKISTAENADFVIGPVRNEHLGKVVGLLPAGSRTASPLDHKAGYLIEGNPGFIQGAPSQQAQWEDMVEWEKEERSHEYGRQPAYGTIVVTSLADSASYRELKSALNRAGMAFRTCMTDASHDIQGWENANSPVKAGCVFLALSNEATLNNAIRNLSLYARDLETARVYACGKVNSYRTIHIEDVHRLSMRVSCPYFVDYKDSTTLRFIHTYRAFFRSEPTQFAFQGYDLTRFLAESKARWGSNWDRGIDTEEKCEMLQACFKLRRKENGGLENNAARRIQFLPDYSIRVFRADREETRHSL